ncbi:DNA polymerase III subunit delta [Allorhizobium sp. BGMRC 0089]|uniref:DNA polymerase III subunit delta n=1 Tax=Allorhizobium sonneratiae TaxID=2934936 RepID=UPI002033CFC6|nr:DNA polymerase III subunit delta [Allorhizobium sonneratiae]MCM2294391.1 DNA polymerase III subunit delta [Allorhizobium sonneratiae]
MVEVKSHEFDGFLTKSARHYRLFLVYGPDAGLVSERGTALAKSCDIPLDDPFAVIRFDASDIQSDPGRLLDEMNAIGLFGGKRLVWIRGAANEKGIVDGLQILANEDGTDNILLIEAGDLKKTSGLRKAAEGSRAVAAIPCYQDDSRAINSLIDQEFSAAGKRLTPAARQLLAESLGGDRRASRNEISKLLLYCLHDDLIDEQHVTDVIGDASAISTDEAVDAVLAGNPDQLLHAIAKISTSKTPMFLVLQSCLKQFQLLDLMRSDMDNKRQQAGQVMQSLGRSIHFKRKPLIEKALRNWNRDSISQELKRLQSTIFMTRRQPGLEDTLALQTLLAITLQSARKNNS